MSNNIVKGISQVSVAFYEYILLFLPMGCQPHPVQRFNDTIVFMHFVHIQEFHSAKLCEAVVLETHEHLTGHRT